MKLLFEGREGWVVLKRTPNMEKDGVYTLVGELTKPEDRSAYWNPGAEELGEAFGAGDYLTFKPEDSYSYVEAHEIRVVAVTSFEEGGEDEPVAAPAMPWDEEPTVGTERLQPGQRCTRPIDVTTGRHFAEADGLAPCNGYPRPECPGYEEWLHAQGERADGQMTGEL